MNIAGSGFIKKIIVNHKQKLAATYGLTVLENIFYIVSPFLLGKAINDLANNSIMGLLLFVVAYICQASTGVARRIYDTKAFTHIFNATASEMITQQIDKDIDNSKISARTWLIQDLITFFEVSFPFYFVSIASIVGSLVMLIQYDWRIVLVCVALLIPIIINNKKFGIKMGKLQVKVNDQLEEQVAVLETKKIDDIKNHFSDLRFWRIKVSNLGAKNFAITEIFILGVLACSLFILKGNEHYQAGDYYAIYSYVNRYATGFDFVPDMIEQLSRISDIEKRIDVSDTDDVEVDIDV
jgi:ABC-type bacteriocin/lantibiotic exporter with double-glycine peptidase domain